MSLADIRARYARELMALARADHRAVETAFAAVPRERYLTPPPWRIFAPGGFLDEETSDPAKLYDDVLVVLDATKGINNGQPSLHAAWMAAVDPRPGEAVVQVGIGAGYYTAILAALVGEGGRVEAYEIDPGLAAVARANLAGLPQVAVHAATGVGTALPGADVVYVSAGAAAPDPDWLRALSEGGRLVFPWQPEPRRGATMLVTRATAGFRVSLASAVSFVPCVGAGPAEARSRGLPSRPAHETRSVWFAAERPPDESATAIYAEIWLSAREV